VAGEPACTGSKTDTDTDSDNDGLADFLEVRALQTDACRADTDGLPDLRESVFLPGNTSDEPDAFNDDAGPDDRCSRLDPTVSWMFEDVQPGLWLIRVAPRTPGTPAGPNDLHGLVFTSRPAEGKIATSSG